MDSLLLKSGDFMEYILIGAGSDLGVHVNGAKSGPATLINNLDFNIKKELLIQDEKIIKSLDKHDLEKNLDEVNKFNENLYKILNANIDKFIITIGGDHSISIPSVLTSCKKDNIGLIWIDAHPDYNTFDTTITGNLHGLPCACVTGYDCGKLSYYHNGTFVNPENTVIVGARSIDKLEMENLKKAGVTIFTTKDIKKYGTKEIMDKAFAIANNGTNKIHISYDLDVIDPLVAPGVSVPEVNGIDEEEAYGIASYLHDNMDKMVALDVVEFNPKYDINNKTLNIATKILNIIIK